MATTVTWLYIGNRSFLDSSPNSNITQSQINNSGIVGYSASGPSHIKAIDSTGPTYVGNNGWGTTYQNGTATFSYDQAPSGSATGGQIRTFVRAEFEIVTGYDSNDDPIIETRSGIIMQDSNGNLFMRPAADTEDTWNGITSIYSITVKSASVIDQNTRMANVSFNAEIKEVEIICFAGGTLIRTERGDVPVEDLAAGDRVWTADRGHQPVQWAGASRLGPEALAANPHLRPIRIRAGALGGGLPRRDLLVSPQHRILVHSRIAERMFGQSEVLVAVKQLLALDGIEVAVDVTEVTYHHFLLDRHAVVEAEGAATESLFTGAEALKAVSAESRAEILALFPELAADQGALPSARPLARGRQGRTLAARHARNHVALVA